MSRAIIVLGFFITVMILIAGCTTTQTTDELQSFSPAGGGFSISLPGTPTYEARPIDTAAGRVISNMYTVDKGNVAYLVMYADYPDAMKNADPQVVLNNARDGGVASVHGKLLSETSIALNGYPGKDYTVVVGTQQVRSQIYLVNNRLYSIVVAGPGNFEVLDSFRLTG